MVTESISRGSNREIFALEWRGAPRNLDPFKLYTIATVFSTLLTPGVPVKMMEKTPSDQKPTLRGWNQMSDPTANPLTPRLEMETVQRGLKQLGLFVPIQSLALAGTMSALLQAALLWKQASEILLEVSALSPEECQTLVPDSVSPAFCDPIYISSLCLCYAATSLYGIEDPEIHNERESYLEYAVQHLIKFDAKLENFYDRGLVHEQIGDIYASLFNMCKRKPQEAAMYAENVVKATLKARDYFLHGGEGIEARTKAVEQLIYAGNFSPSLSAKLNFYREAQSLATHSESVLLSAIESKIQAVENQQKREYQNSLIARICNGFWFTS